MNAISLNRLKYLFIEYFVTHWKRDLIVFAALLFTQAIFKYVYLSIDFLPELILLLTPIILLGTSNQLGKKLRGINYLMCPANTKEKLFVNIALVHIYYSTFLFLSCILAQSISTLYPHYDEIVTLHTDIIFILTSPGFWGILLATQSLFIFTSIYFKKNAIVKTLIFFTILFFIFLIIAIIFAQLYEYGVITFDLLNFVVKILRTPYFLHISFYTIAVVFWFLSYLRLKRTEV